MTVDEEIQKMNEWYAKLVQNQKEIDEMTSKWTPEEWAHYKKGLIYIKQISDMYGIKMDL